jgi:hypothetical protein
MTMIGINKEIKENQTIELLNLLWNGQVAESMIKLNSYQTRNESKKSELLGYLEKNSALIINYKRRKEANKAIGSGRMEKGVDTIVARRQKEKAMRA